MSPGDGHVEVPEPVVPDACARREHAATRARYAVYFAPPDPHALSIAGAAWLGRDAANPRDHRPPRCAEVAAPWRYGFHATLKAPMRLTPGHGLADLVAACVRLAAGHAPFDMPPLVVAALGGFVALRPATPVSASHPLRRLADDTVRALDAHRARPAADDLARHVTPDLSERQRGHVWRWGYPHVLDDWRFHMTLTGPLAPDDPRRHELQCAAQAHFASALARPLRCTDLAIFVQTAADQPFRLQRRVPLHSA